MTTTTKQEQVNKVNGLIYATSEERRRATPGQRAAARLEYTTRVSPNSKGDGRFGKIFEVDARWELNPNTSVLKCQRQGLADIIKTVGKKRLNIEAKTGGGNICQLPENVELTPENVLNGITFDLIIYSVDADTSNARVMTPEQFIQLLSEFNPSKPGTFFKRESGQGRNRNRRNIKINNPYYKTRREYLETHEYGISFDEFVEHFKQVK